MSAWSHIVTITAARPESREAQAEAEIIVKALNGHVPVSRKDDGNTITIAFKRAS